MRSHIRYLSVLVGALGAAAFPACTQSEEPTKTSADKLVLPGASHPGGAQIGMGYDTSSESFKSVPCIAAKSGQSALEGNRSAHNQIVRDKSSSGLAQSMNLTARINAKYATATANADLETTQAMTEDDYSDVFLYEMDYELGTRHFKPDDVGNNYTVTSDGVNASQDASGTAWQQVCGDQFVDSVTYGGRFIISYRVDFASRDAKNTFHLAAGGSFSAGLTSAGVSSEVSSALDAVADRTKVTIEIFQTGGDPTKAGQAIVGLAPGATGPDNVKNEIDAATKNAALYVQCDVKHLDQCNQIVANAITYASASFSTGFGAQLADANYGGVPTQYTVAPWSSVRNPQVRPGNPIVMSEVATNRNAIEDHFKLILRDYTEITRLVTVLGTPPNELPPAARKQADYWTQNLREGLSTVNAAVKACYDDMVDATLKLTWSQRLDACTAATTALNTVSLLPTGYLKTLGGYAIAGHYASLKNQQPGLGDAVGPGPYVDTSDIDGIVKQYKNGAIYWHPDVGAWSVDHNDTTNRKQTILGKYLELGAEKSSLGYPATDGLTPKLEPHPGNLTTNSDTYRERHVDFRNLSRPLGPPGNADNKNVGYDPTANGAIYWSRVTGPHAIWGGPYAKWIELRKGTYRAYANLASDTIDEAGVEHNDFFDDNRNFTGAIFSYGDKSGAKSYALCDDVPPFGGTPNHTILTTYNGYGGESGKLGLPKSDVIDMGTYAYAQFEKGVIIGSPHGTYVLPIGLGLAFVAQLDAEGKNLPTDPSEASSGTAQDAGAPALSSQPYPAQYKLGGPIAEPYTTSDGGMVAEFENGFVVMAPTGQGYAVTGPMRTLWNTPRGAGGQLLGFGPTGSRETSMFHYPTSPLVFASSAGGLTAYIQYFQGGAMIARDPTTTPTEVCDWPSGFTFYSLWMKSGGASRATGIGLPGNEISGVKMTAGHDYYIQTFQGGYIRQNAQGDTQVVCKPGSQADGC